MKWGVLALIALLLSPQCSAYEFRNKGKSIKTNRVAHIQGDISFGTEFVFAAEITSTAGLSGPQIILIDSPGGDLIAGQHILDKIYDLKAENTRIICIVDGMAASMAFNILTRCDERYATEKSTFVFHPIAGYTPDHGRMTPIHLRQAAAELEEDNKPYRDANAKALRMSVETYEYYSNRDPEREWTAKQLKARHYLTGIVRTSHAKTDQPSGTPAPQGR